MVRVAAQICRRQLSFCLMKRLVLTVLIVVILVGCQIERQGAQEPTRATPNPAGPTISAATKSQATLAATSPPRPRSTFTPTPTPTASPSPTPTPMAQPVSVSGNPRAQILRSLPPAEDVICGVVDLLDFPLNPPNGNGVARGGGDFGIYRSRYDSYHVGEDWWTGRGRSSFGQPVYSIGHGRITYAAPLGWGRDQGVVIVRHTFSDGHELLSFYGHLDPPSVTLSAGDCVTRGQQVGTIGRPRTPPHLHFEIRSHLPYEPGSGYWWEDPTHAGWRPPSLTIWQERMAVSPGVMWLRPPADRDTAVIGISGGHTAILMENNQLIGLDVADGHQRWLLTSDIRVEQAALDPEQSKLYLASQLGQIESYRLPDPATNGQDLEPGDVPQRSWAVDLDVVGIPALIPLPQGGVVFNVRDELTALSQGGQLLWQVEDFDRPLDWAKLGDQILLSTLGPSQSLWIVDRTGIKPWEGLKGGVLSSHDKAAFLFNDSGLYRLDPADKSNELLGDWPQDTLRSSDMLVLEDGTILLAYARWADRRLILYDDAGNLVWQRALPDSFPGRPTLLLVDERPYLAIHDISSDSGSISIFAIDPELVGLIHLFTGGTRTPAAEQTSFHSTGDQRLFVNIGGGHLVALDLGAAATSMDSASDSFNSLPQ